MRREVEGQLNTFLLNRRDIGNIYSGVSNDPPTSLTRLQVNTLQKIKLQEGLNILYSTSDRGQYEIIAYPKDFGQLTTIFQNKTEINILEAWNSIELKKDARDYYLYYTALPQFGDRSVFMFQL